MVFAEVAVDAPVEHGRTFTYSVPPGLDLRPGHLVRVPFGPRRMQGVVFDLAQESQVAETRDVLSVVFEDEVLDDTGLDLARWVSDYYMCSRFEAAAAMLPPGGRTRPRTYYALRDDEEADTARLTGLQTRLLDYLSARGRTSEGRLARALGEAARASVRSLVRRGLVDRTYGSLDPSVRTKLRKYVALAPEFVSRGHELVSQLKARGPRQAALLERLLREKEPLPLAVVNKEFGTSAVTTLIKKGLVVKKEIQVDRDPLAGRVFPLALPLELTDAQLTSASAVRETMDDPSSAPRHFLLKGVTGSGKTEVYLDATEHCLAIGKRAIVMVPEIALTHQTIERFAARFPGNVAVLHSGLTPGQRFDQWWRIRRGEYGVVIGSRSAAFAPQPDLGLIVVDEEHEWTYKQHDTVPRYHARDVARKLAGLTGAVVVSGSASPDVGSYHAATKGRSRLLTLPQRVGTTITGMSNGAGLASVDVVDMRRELREGNRLIFSRDLMRKLEAALDAGDQAILFLNRRGSATHLQCRNCGLALKCRRCDVGLTFHRNPSRLVCHYCGERRRPPPKCPQCKSFRLSYYGIGTQTVVDEVTKHFPKAEVLRWDRDSTTGRGADEEILERFRTRQAQVLVGTQVIAKGLHFPAVTLVGVVMADLGLNAPDYQAGERTFQILCQVAGRAGRGWAAGDVVVQTYQPDNYAIKAAATQDYDRFYPQEIAFRREQNNPPLTRLIRLLYSHTNRAVTEGEATRWAELLRLERDGWGFSDVELIGPTPAHPPRLRGRYRWQLILRGANPRMLLDKLTVPHGWTIDVDPVGPA